MNKTVYKGVCTAAITPFTEDGIDYKAFERQIDFQISNGIDALCFLGTTGESSTVNEKEYDKIAKFAFDKVAGRVKFILGTGYNCTDVAVKRTVFAEKLGVDGVLAVTPYYNKCTQKGLIDYYKRICESVDTPVLCYNVPARTGVNILPETMAKIAEMKNVAGIKEASGNIKQIKETANLIDGKCALYSGDDHLNYYFLSLGAFGTVSAVSNLIPRETGDIFRFYFSGRKEQAKALQERTLPLIRELFKEVNPIPVKAGMKLMGLDSGILRSPLTEIEPKHLKSLTREMIRFGLKIYDEN